MSDIFQLLEQRVSAHQFAGSKLSDTELRVMVKAATHSPTAYNLQNWHFTAVCSEAMKQRLHEAAFLQPKILQAAAVIVISGDLQGHRHLEDRLRCFRNRSLWSDKRLHIPVCTPIRQHNAMKPSEVLHWPECH